MMKKERVSLTRDYLLLRVALVVAVILSATNAVADLGRFEINQAVVDAAGGFPFSISESGSYVLTGDLIVTSPDTEAILIAADSVTLDLNGFRVVGPHVCADVGCVIGTANGISAVPLASVRHSTVYRGQISGFGRDCLSLGDDARAHDLEVFSCGQNGISAVLRSSLSRNKVSFVGRFGINMLGDSHYADNSSTNAALRGIGAAIRGGLATAGNYCDDGSCSRVPLRRYYLSQSFGNGAVALDQCAANFHMASLYEIRETSMLQYDATLGQTGADTGSGPITNIFGWIRTGRTVSTTAGGTGEVNCDAWTSSTGADDGTVVSLSASWTTSTSINETAPFRPDSFNCSLEVGSWCVEN